MSTPFTPPAELPVRSNTPLPFIPLQRKVLPKPALIAIVVMMLSIVGTVLDLGGLRFVFLLLEFIAVIAIIWIAVKVGRDRRKVHDELNKKTPAFLAAVQDRYGVTMTETIFIRLVEGGVTRLSDMNGRVSTIVMQSDAETQTTKLIVDENW